MTWYEGFHRYIIRREEGGENLEKCKGATMTEAECSVLSRSKIA